MRKVPSIIQGEIAECGLACLAMVAAHHGHHVGLRELRQRHQLSLKGASLSQLISIAHDMGFDPRPLQLELAELDRLGRPCILHWDANHFVVLVKVGRRGVTIMDPAYGRRTLSFAETSRHFTGVALELTPAGQFQQKKAAPSVSVRQLAGRVDGIWRSLGLVVALSIGLQFFSILAPFYMQWVVDQVLVSADRDLLTLLGLGFGMLLVLQVGTGLLRGWAVVYLSSRLGLQWMGNVFGHLLKLPLEFFEKRHLGDVVSRIGSVQAIQKTLTTSFVEALIDGLMAIATLGMMLLYSWKLALVTLAAVALYLGLRWVSFAPMKSGTEQQLVASAKQQSYLLETIRGIQSVKVGCVEQKRVSGYANLLHATVGRDVWLANLGLGFGGANKLLFGAERIAVIWIGAVLGLQNVFSVGMLVAYLAYKDQFASRVGSLIDKWIEFRMLRLHGERLADIVLTPPVSELGEGLGAGVPGGAALEVQGLSFRYADREPWVLQDCCFRVEPGESVAIVGASGCGKTTMAKLLLGLMQPSSGVVSFGGIKIDALGFRNYRQMVGAVMQDDQLFAGSIMDNIAFGDDSADPVAVASAASLAAIHDEIMAMPMGYLTLIGDMGTTLSGGQKQRIILARALYRKPQLLILDEATSHLDMERERLVNEAVRKLNLTKIIIAHRPETIASADRVLVLHAGKIVDEVRPLRANETAAA